MLHQYLENPVGWGMRGARAGGMIIDEEDGVKKAVAATETWVRVASISNN